MTQAAPTQWRGADRHPTKPNANATLACVLGNANDDECVIHWCPMPDATGRGIGNQAWMPRAAGHARAMASTICTAVALQRSASTAPKASSSASVTFGKRRPVKNANWMSHHGSAGDRFQRGHKSVCASRCQMQCAPTHPDTRSPQAADEHPRSHRCGVAHQRGFFMQTSKLRIVAAWARPTTRTT